MISRECKTNLASAQFLYLSDEVGKRLHGEENFVSYVTCSATDDTWQSSIYVHRIPYGESFKQIEFTWKLTGQQSAGRWQIALLAHLDDNILISLYLDHLLKEIGSEARRRGMPKVWGVPEGLPYIYYF